MTLDEELLQKARLLGTNWEDAERDAQRARADYNTAIRRLHLAGGSLREIAGALRLSHQRVQQVVSEAGGTWWSKVWKSRGAESPDLCCTFCGGSRHIVAKLISGPNVYICDRCVEASERTLGDHTKPAASAAFNLVASGTRIKCSFCGKRAAGDRPIVVTKPGNICRPCVETCRQILVHNLPAPAH